MTIPFIGFTITVPPEWIDINGHMNATHYGLIVYDAHVAFTTEIGLGDAYVNATRCGKAVLESHMIYEREIARNDMVEVRSWLLAVDTKRLHFFHEIYNITRGHRAGAAEQVDIHIDLSLRRSSAMPEAVYRALQRRVEATLALPLPEKIGSVIKPPKNSWRETGN